MDFQGKPIKMDSIAPLAGRNLSLNPYFENR
jgi:hypothetical protein